MLDQDKPAPLLTATGLTVVRGANAVVRSLDLRLDGGQLAWLGGPSGIGKSTLLMALARLLPMEAGELTLEGVSASRIPAPQWRSQVLLVPQPPLALGPSVAEDLLVPFGFRSRHRRPRPGPEAMRRELDRLGLGTVALDQAAEQLSQGQLARLALARALLARPRVLLLDEPTANLDTASASRVEQCVTDHCRSGGAAVVASHGPPWEAAVLEVALLPSGDSGEVS